MSAPARPPGDPVPPEHAERVYAGVLGKVIGVYLGRPFEGWPHELIRKRLGDIEHYVHDRLDVPLVVTDDDITGTFTFLRALEDHDAGAELGSREVGWTWLNYLIRERTVLWWGGMGNSTEHTAWLRLRSGIEAPQSGAATLNGKVVSEQIGAQIFIDGWAMVAPGDPDLAVRLATAAARVSHDGEAVHGARVLAAMESMAFVEGDMERLIETALGYIPPDSVIARMIGDLRRWHATESDWEASRSRLAERYGYDTYGGNCHVVPNHGLIILSLLHGESDFADTLRIVNTCGWDTDCNSGNVGCLLGIKDGLAGIEAGLERGLDWRGPVADRLYLPTADGGRAISDCASEAVHVVNAGQRLAGKEAWKPANGAQFHFSFPGSVQGFHVAEGAAEIANVKAPSAGRALCIDTRGEARVASPVFIPSLDVARWFENRVYPLLASPRIFPGQTVEAVLGGGEGAAGANLYVAAYGDGDETVTFDGKTVELAAGARKRLTLDVPTMPGPIFLVGVRVLPPAERGPRPARCETQASVCLESLGWSGSPAFELVRPRHRGGMWRRAWVNGVDLLAKSPEMFRLIQNAGMGLLMQGTREWRNYTVSATLAPHMVRRAGVAARVQGLTRFVGLFLAPGNRLQLVRMLHTEEVLDETDLDWRFGESRELTLRVSGSRLVGSVDGEALVQAEDDALDCGGIGLAVEEGRLGVDRVEVS